MTTTYTQADLTTASIIAEFDHLILPDALRDALGHDADHIRLDYLDCVEVLADPDLAPLYGQWVRSRIDEVLGLAVAVTRVAIAARRTVS